MLHVYLWFILFFFYTIGSNNIPSGGVSGNLSFILDRPIIWKTNKYIDYCDNSFWCVLGFNT